MRDQLIKGIAFVFQGSGDCQTFPRLEEGKFPRDVSEHRLHQ